MWVWAGDQAQTWALEFKRGRAPESVPGAHEPSGSGRRERRVEHVPARWWESM